MGLTVGGWLVGLGGGVVILLTSVRTIRLAALTLRRKVATVWA